jgi:hypothetical protein
LFFSFGLRYINLSGFGCQEKSYRYENLFPRTPKNISSYLFCIDITKLI